MALGFFHYKQLMSGLSLSAEEQKQLIEELAAVAEMVVNEYLRGKQK